MTAPRYLASIAPLKDGGAIVVGGSGTGTLAVAEVWNGARFIPTISVMPVSGVLGQAIDVRVITNIPDKPVVLTVSGVSYGPLATDASGSVVFSGVSTAGLTPGHNENAIVATLEPGETTAGGRATGAIEIIAAATQLVMAPLTAKFGDTILLTASLKTTAGSPVANQLVRFDVLGNGTYDVSSSTDTAGKATATLTWAAAQALGIKVGSYNVIASFSGLAGSFTGATTTASLTIVDTVAPIITVLRPPAGGGVRERQSRRSHQLCLLRRYGGRFGMRHDRRGHSWCLTEYLDARGVQARSARSRCVGQRRYPTVTYTVADTAALAPADVWVSHDNKISILDSLTNQVKHQITSLSQPFAVTLSRDGKRAYVSDDGTNQLIAFDVATRAELGRVLVGRRPSYIGMSTDDRRVFVANTNDNTVSVVDALTMSVSGTIAVGSIPYGLTVVPQSRGSVRRSCRRRRDRGPGQDRDAGHLADRGWKQPADPGVAGIRTARLCHGPEPWHGHRDRYAEPRGSWPTVCRRQRRLYCGQCRWAQLVYRQSFFRRSGPDSGSCVLARRRRLGHRALPLAAWRARPMDRACSSPAPKAANCGSSIPSRTPSSTPSTSAAGPSLLP